MLEMGADGKRTVERGQRLVSSVSWPPLALSDVGVRGYSSELRPLYEVL